jgi:hypothetical protein
MPVSLFPPLVVLAAALFAVFSAVLIMPFESRGLDRTAFVLTVIALVASVYCIAAGLHLLSGWHDPFATATSEELANASTRGRGRGGLLLLGGRYLPWVLIGGGVYVGYQQAHILRYMLRDLRSSSGDDAAR